MNWFKEPSPLWNSWFNSNNRACSLLFYYFRILGEPLKLFSKSKRRFKENINNASEGLAFFDPSCQPYKLRTIHYQSQCPIIPTYKLILCTFCLFVCLFVYINVIFLLWEAMRMCLLQIVMVYVVWRYKNGFGVQFPWRRQLLKNVNTIQSQKEDNHSEKLPERWHNSVFTVMARLSRCNNGSLLTVRPTIIVVLNCYKIECLTETFQLLPGPARFIVCFLTICNKFITSDTVDFT